MNEIVAEVRLVKEPGFLYFLRGNEIWRQPMEKGGSAAAEPVWCGTFERDPDYFYFIDPSGNVVRSRLEGRPAPTVERRPEAPRLPARRFRLPLPEDADDDLLARVPKELAFLVGSPGRAKLELRGRWASLADPDVRALADWVLDAEPSVLHLGTEVWIELTAPGEGSFLLRAPLAKTEVLAKLRTVNAADDRTMIELYETFGESDGFVVPSARHTFETEFPSHSRWKDVGSRLDAPVVFRAPNGDGVFFERATRHFTWASHEEQKLEHAASSFGELLRRYLRAKRHCREFDVFTARKLGPA